MPADATATVPILYYHRVQAIPAAYPTWSAAAPTPVQRPTTCCPAAFAAQLDWLLQHGYTTILPRDLVAHWDHGAPLPARPVIISFDDGSRDWVRTVLPMLKAHGMVAEFYLTLDAIEHGNLTWTEVRRLAAAGNGIGAHDVHHVQLAGWARVTRARSTATMWSEVSDVRLDHRGQRRRLPGLDGVRRRRRRRDPRAGGQDAGYTSARGILRGIVQAQTTRFRMRVVRIGVHDDVSNLLQGAWSPSSRRSRRGCAGSRTRRPTRAQRPRSGRPGDVAGDTIDAMDRSHA